MEILDRMLSGALAGLLAVGTAGAVFAADPEPQSTASLTLTNEDLGLSADDLRARGTLPGGSSTAKLARANDESVTRESAKVDEATAQDPSAAARAAGTEPESVAKGVAVANATPPLAAAGPPPSNAPPQSEPLSFEACMERSIRAGNHFEESEHVCRAVVAPPPSDSW